MEPVYLTIKTKQTLINDINSPEVSIDPGIKHYVEKINGFLFINTTQCCQGHPENGYLSVMVTKEIFEEFEQLVIPQLIDYCEDIVKRFESIGHKIIARYIFRFKTGCVDNFFTALIKLLSRY